MRPHFQCGATIVEVAISISIFLALLFFSFWISIVINSAAALDYSVRTAMILAFTRGDLRGGDFAVSGDLAAYLGNGALWRSVIGFGVLQPYKLKIYMEPQPAPEPAKPYVLTHDRAARFWNGCNNDNVARPLPQVLYRGVDLLAANTFYQNETLKVFRDKKSNAGGAADNNAGCAGALKLSMLPPVYALTLAYIYETLHASVGPTIRYPCDPDLPAPLGSAGCLGCRFLSPDQWDEPTRYYADYGDPTGDPAGKEEVGLDSVQLGVTWAPRVPQRRLFVECEYKPALRFLSPEGTGLANYLSPTLLSRFFFVGQADD